MNILVVEDNDIKFELVVAALGEMGIQSEPKRAGSYQSGVEALLTCSFDFVVLDMTLPVFDMEHTLVGADVLTFGGEFVLRECKRKRVASKFVVLSQYDTFVRNHKEVTFNELRSELLRDYGEIVVGCVRLDSSSVSWKTELASLLKGNESTDR